MRAALILAAVPARWRPSALGGLLAALVAVGGAFGATPASGANQSVTVVDSDYIARTVAVLPGETVTWTYASGGDHHNVHFDDGLYQYPDSPEFPFWMGARTFPATGTYRYYCDEHGGPGGLGMSGTVHVNATGTLPPNVAPTASFIASPGVVAIGTPVTFNASASSDSDGSVVRYEWDLDANGSYETDTGFQPTTTRSYPTVGTKTVGLRVTDNQGLDGVTSRSVEVTDPPPAAVPAPPPPPPPPPPVEPGTSSGPEAPPPAAPKKLGSSVSHVATARRRYTVLTALSVRGALAGSTVRISCSGAGCPFKLQLRRITRSVRRLDLLSLVRGKRLRAGTTLEIRVTRPGAVGVVRRLTIRAGRSPKRDDLCIAPGATKPGPCPV